MVRTLISIFCVFVNFLTLEASYSKWCEKDELFKPSISMYKNRKGDALVENGAPKFYPTDNLQDIYVCLNGPAWLYFARHSAIGDVYHEPQFRVYQHECQAFNGKPGHGSHTDPLILMGIYLLGEEDDYRQPSIHLFTAPLLNNDTMSYENTTSIMTINNSPCTITKGTDTTIWVHPRPKEQYSYCKMPYQNIDIMYTTPATPTDVYNPAPATLKNLFKNDNSIKKGTCEPEVQPASLNLDTLLSSVEVKFGQYYKVIEDKCGNIKKIFDPTTLTSRADELDTTSATGIPSQIKTENDTINDAATDPTAKAAAITKKKELEQKLQEAMFEADAFNKYAVIEKICDAAVPDRNQTFNDLYVLFKDTVGGTGLGTLATKKKEYDEAKIKLQEEIDKNGTAGFSQTEVENANKTVETTRIAYEGEPDANPPTPDSLADAQKRLVNAEKVWKNYVENVTIATVAIEAHKNSKGKTFQATKSTDLSNILPIFQNFTDSITTENNNSCFPLPTVASACESSKPNLKRACHFLKAITDGPDVCQEYENGSAPGGVLSTTSERLGKDFNEVMDLIEDIFAQACSRLDSNFPKRINRIFKCYLLKPIEHGGVGFDIRDKTSKKDTDFKGVWNQIKLALVNCKQEKRRLIFKRDPSDSNRKNYKLWMRNSTGKYLVDIHLHKEQADLQFPFNFAIDMHFKMFATVMGLCMASATYVNRNSYITPVFFSKYTDLFFMDLEAEWTDPRDNKIFNLILGNYKKGTGKFWANRCMEASFITSEDTNYRPPRKLYVNSHTEGNFFISGKLANTQGMYPF